MPVTSMPSRRAAIAWPSSCSSSVPKNSSVAATAATNPSVLSSSWFPNGSASQ